MVFDFFGCMVGMGEFVSYDVGVVYCVIGYLLLLVFGVFFDVECGIVLNVEGCVFDGDGVLILCLYVIGWIKCGLIGFIGLMKLDVVQIVMYFVEDLVVVEVGLVELVDLFVYFGVVVDWEGWLCIDEVECCVGIVCGREWIKIVDCCIMFGYVYFEFVKEIV